MGARAQVKIEDTGVYLYTHWGSQELPQDVQKGLVKAAQDGRLDDVEYLTRIIFDAMKEDDLGTTGFGIGTNEHGDLDYDPIVIDCSTMTVTYNGTPYGIQEFIDKDFTKEGK